MHSPCLFGTKLETGTKQGTKHDPELVSLDVTNGEAEKGESKLNFRKFSLPLTALTWERIERHLNKLGLMDSNFYSL